MSEEMQLTREQVAVWRLLALGTTGASGELAKFAGWLMTALGAALTFFVANHKAVSDLIELSYLRISLFLFAASMLSGLIALWLSAPVKAGLALSSEVLELRTQHLDAAAFSKAFASGLIFPYRCIFLCRLASTEATDALSPIRSPAKLSQYQALLIIFQFLCATAVVFVLALGIKV